MKRLLSRLLLVAALCATLISSVHARYVTSAEQDDMSNSLTLSALASHYASLHQGSAEAVAYWQGRESGFNDASGGVYNWPDTDVVSGIMAGARDYCITQRDNEPSAVGKASWQGQADAYDEAAGYVGGY